MYNNKRYTKRITLTTVLKFGKYKYYTIRKIIKDDLGYMEWLLLNPLINNKIDTSIYTYMEEIHNSNSMNKYILIED